MSLDMEREKLKCIISLKTNAEGENFEMEIQ